MAWLRPLGSTGLSVSALGLGAGALGEASLDAAAVERLLQGALDLGVTLIDTAPSYGLSEERIGRFLAHRRQDFVLSTKCGYGVPGVEDWTPACIQKGVEQALARLRTDVLDIVHLHSCPRETLERPGLLEALEAQVRSGKVRVAAYSGENDALGWAVASGRFGVVQRSVNLCDQGLYDAAEQGATPEGLGLLGKRALANAAWDHARRPSREDVAVYWDRLHALGLDPEGLEPVEYALRFAAFAPGVGSCLIGTQRLENLARLKALWERGPLPPPQLERTRAAWRARGRGWPGLI